MYIKLYSYCYTANFVIYNTHIWIQLPTVAQTIRSKAVLSFFFKFHIFLDNKRTIFFIVKAICDK